MGGKSNAQKMKTYFVKARLWVVIQTNVKIPSQFLRGR